LIDEGEIEPALPSLRVSVDTDRRDAARLRTVSTMLALVGETFPKLGEIDMTSKAGAVAAAHVREIEVMDGALPKILCAEETGDPVSDLYEALY